METNKMIIFLNNDEDTRRCAIFISQLIREGVTFEIKRDKISTEITLTGGF